MRAWLNEVVVCTSACVYLFYVLYINEHLESSYHFKATKVCRDTFEFSLNCCWVLCWNALKTFEEGYKILLNILFEHFSIMNEFILEDVIEDINQNNSTFWNIPNKCRNDIRICHISIIYYFFSWWGWKRWGDGWKWNNCNRRRRWKG